MSFKACLLIWKYYVRNDNIMVKKIILILYLKMEGFQKAVQSYDQLLRGIQTAQA